MQLRLYRVKLWKNTRAIERLIERTGFRRWQNEMKRETCRTGAAFMGNNAHPCFSQTLVVIARARIFIFEHPIPFLYALLSRYANDRNERWKNWEKERERETFVWRGLPDIFIESRRSPATILLDFFSFFFLLKSNEVWKRCRTILRFYEHRGGEFITLMEFIARLSFEEHV